MRLIRSALFEQGQAGGAGGVSQAGTSFRSEVSDHGDYGEARAHLKDALNLLTDCADIYRRCDDVNRRLCNQAFFTKVHIDEDDQLRVENNRSFEMLLDPEVNANALNWTQNRD